MWRMLLGEGGDPAHADHKHECSCIATLYSGDTGEGFPGTASTRGTLICRDTGGQIRAEARSCGALALSSVHIGPSFMWQRGYLCQYLKRLSRHRSRVSGRAGWRARLGWFSSYSAFSQWYQISKTISFQLYKDIF